MTDIEGNKQKTIVPVQIPVMEVFCSECLPSVVTHLLIPMQVGAVPGGSFEFIAANGKTILVSVPPDAVPGGFIDVCIDDDDDGKRKKSITTLHILPSHDTQLSQMKILSYV